MRALVLLLLVLLPAAPVFARGTSGKLIETGGVSQLEGAGGGGLTPWALITGYGTRDQIGANAHYTQIRLSDFSFDSAGAAVGIHDRLEISFAEQRFHTEGAGVALGLGSSFFLRQNILGVKLRVLGDALYYQDSWEPQVAIGLQFKQNDREALVRALGATDDSSTDFYVAITKVALARSLVLNATLRFTEGNHMGLLGFGGDRNDGHELELEGSAAWLLSRHLAVGLEYRGNPNNLTFAREDDYKDIFVALFPSKNLSFTLAYVDLGSIATFGAQEGAYLSVQAGF